MKNKRKRLIENGFISKNGIFFNNDIHLNYIKPHKSVYFDVARALFALVLSFATMSMFASFILNRPNYGGILLSCSLTIGLLCVIKSKNTGIRVIGCVFLVLYFIYYAFNYNNIYLGFCSTVYLYLEHAKQPSSILGASLSGIDPIFYPQLSAFFLQFLSSVVSCLISLACVFRLDFLLLFVSTFPFFELGMYWGWPAPLITVVILIIGWVMIISLTSINQRTNRAGRKNTFAVHERKHAYYLTSEAEKSKVFFILMRFIVLVCAALFTFIVLFSALLGYERSEKVNRYRSKISNFVDNFSLDDLGDMFADYDGGFDLFGTKAVGGTNGGILGDTNGISFNGTTALTVDTKPLNETLYLRGYVAGDYHDNRWTPIEYKKGLYFSEDLSKFGIIPQDINYFEITDISNLLNTTDNIELTEDDEISVKVKAASKKYVYAPYDSYYSDTDQKNKYKMRPYYDSYVRLGTDNYKITYRKPCSDDLRSIKEIIANGSQPYELNNTIPRDTIDSYTEFVNSNYSKIVDSPGLQAAYKQIDKMYLNGDRSYKNVVEAIDRYFLDNGFTYTLEPGKTPSGKDFVDYFLTEQKKGYCSYYASAGTMLLRKFGFNARYVEGYIILPTMCDASKDICTVNVTDKCAHAWTEVYIQGIGWINVDFTPGYNNDNPNMTEKEKNPTPSGSDDSSKPDESSSLPESSQSETDNSEESSSSEPEPSSQQDSSQPQSSSASDQSTSSYSDSGGGTITDQSSQNSHITLEPSPPVKTELSLTTKFIIAVIVFIIAFVIVIVLRRIFMLRTMESNCFNADPIERLKNILGYTIKYLELLDITISNNITDMQLCDELLIELEKMDIHVDKELKYLFMVTQDAYMGEHEPNEEELDKAYEYLNYIAHIAVRPKLTPIRYFTSMFINCMY